MKKLLAILLALAVIGGFAFAQVTFSGYERGIGYVTKDSSSIVNRVRLNANVADADGNYGAFFRFQSADAAAPTTSYGYGWVKIANMITVTGGKLGNFDYGPYWSGWSELKLGNVGNDCILGGDEPYDGTMGFLVQATPVAGLSLGLAYLPSGKIGGADFGINAMYTAEGIGSAVVEAQLGSSAKTTSYSASVDFTGVKDLSVVAGYKHSDADTAAVFGILDYTIAGVALQAAPEYNLDSKDLYLEGFAHYTVGALTFGVIGAYDQGGMILGKAGTAVTYKVDMDPTSPTVGDVIVDKAAVADAPSKYLVGGELYYKVGKAMLMTGLYFDDATEMSIPLVVKVGF